MVEKKDIDFCWNEVKFTDKELSKLSKTELMQHISSLYEYVKINV